MVKQRRTANDRGDNGSSRRGGAEELKGILSQHLSDDHIRELEKAWDRPVGDRFASNVEAPDMSGQSTSWTPWLKAFHGLKEFRRIHGHCNVAQTDKVHRRLGKWVQRQRFKYRHNEMPIDEFHKLESIGFEWTPKRGPRRTRRTNNDSSSSSSNRAAAAAAATAVSSSSRLAVAPESTIEEERRNDEQEEDVNRSRSTCSTPVGVVRRQQQESSSPVAGACSIRGKDSEQPALPPTSTTTTCDLNGVAGALLELQHGGRVRASTVQQSQQSPTLVSAAKEQQQQRAGGQVVRQLSDNNARGSTARQEEATTTRLFDLAGLLDARQQRSNQEQQHHLCRLSGLGRRRLEEPPRQFKIPLDHHQGSGVVQLPPQLTSSVAQLRALQSRRNFVERALYQSRLGELQRLREQRLMVARCFAANGNGRRDGNLPKEAPKTTNNDSSFQRQQQHSKQQPAESDEMIIPSCPPSMSSCPSNNNNGSEEAAVCAAAICCAAARDQSLLCPPAARREEQQQQQQPREAAAPSSPPPCAAAAVVADDDDDEAAAEAAIDAARKMILGE